MFIWLTVISEVDVPHWNKRTVTIIVPFSRLSVWVTSSFSSAELRVRRIRISDWVAVFSRQFSIRTIRTSTCVYQAKPCEFWIEYRLWLRATDCGRSWLWCPVDTGQVSGPLVSCAVWADDLACRSRCKQGAHIVPNIPRSVERPLRC